MGRASLREKILSGGLQLVHERGFSGATVRDIAKAADVPLGSFTNHFTSKEVFGLEILNLYFAKSKAIIANTLLNDSRDPLERLGAYVDANRDFLQQCDMKNGCLLGNFSAEVAEQSDILRVRLVEIFAEIAASLDYCLRAAITSGEIPAESDTKALGHLIIAALQGAILLSKTEQSPASVDNFKNFLFSKLLR